MVERAGGYSPHHLTEHRAAPDTRSEPAAELLSTLRPFWRGVYGDRHGLLACFSGRREGSRLATPREIYFLWPGGAPNAAAWLVEEVARAREVYQRAHLLTRPRRLKPYVAPLSALYVDLDHASLDHPAVPEP